MSSTQYITDASTRHAVFLQRYAGAQSKKAMTALNRLRRDIMARLSQEPTQFQAQRLSSVLDEIDQIAKAAFTDMGVATKHGAMELAASEAEFSAKLYTKGTSANFAIPSEGALLSAVEMAPMSAPLGAKALTIDEALAQFGTKKAAQIAQVIADSVVLGDTTPQISSKISNLMTTLQRRQIDTLVRTVTNHISSVARSAVYQQNADILDGYKWVATLDSSTTFICASRDGEIYQEGIGPMPPAHWGCRSTTVPVVKDEFSIALKGKRPSVGAEGAEAVSSRTTYGGWLKKQPIEFVDEALGPERSALFRSGKIKIDGFVDPTGRVYTLEQLQSRNPLVFAEN